MSAGARGHIAVLLAVLAALKAADYWVRRYETTNERRGFVQGATYSVVHAQLPALLLLSVVAIVTAALYLSTLRTESWRLPLISSAIWLVLAVLAGYIYPAAVQGLVVNPNQKAREAPFIERNVFATREAMGLTDVARPCRSRSNRSPPSRSPRTIRATCSRSSTSACSTRASSRAASRSTVARRPG